MATCRTCAYLRKCIEKATKEGCEHNVNFDPKDGCTGIGYKSNTNADRIRAMSDEGLTAFLMLLTVHGQRPWCDFHCEKDEKYGCENCISRWLQQPAEEET